MARKHSGKRGRSGGGRRKGGVQRGGAARSRRHTSEADSGLVADPFSGELWDSLRQGARNVAGVRYQMAVTAYLLAESRRGALPFVEIIPEGFEDIDCLAHGSKRWFVQVKEMGAGAGRLTAASLANAISHAAAVAPSPSRIVVVTDAQLGGQIAQTGWDQTIARTAGYDIGSIIDALVRNDHQREQANELLTRVHLVRLPWNLAPATTKSLQDCYSINPTAAGLILSSLLGDLTGVAANQRSTAADRPERRGINDLDTLVQATMSAIDVDGLETAVRLGICEIADFMSGPGTGLDDFLLGVDVVPSHIGADYDVIRPGPTRAIQVGIEQRRYVLLAGPSGSGKSAQMWRSAHDLSPGTRVVRVHRLERDSEVDELVRYVKLLNPGAVGSVAVCCDDLGRPRTARWPLAARRLLEQPGVVLLGAVRQEDFTAELLRYGGEFVNLSLDDDTAIAIADQMAFVGAPLALEVPEAVQAADGQLMEYVALLTSGSHMRAVLAAQVQSLLEFDDYTVAALARLVCAAHVLGVSLEASTIGRVTDVGRASLSRALRWLQDEHIVTSEDQVSWRGLHQRRSEVLTELLHETPPPSLSETMGAVLTAVPPTGLGWSLRRIVELFPDLIVDQTVTVVQAVSECSSAEELAILFESLERADNSRTAKSCIPVLEHYRRRQVRLLDWAMFVCNDKFAGVRLGTGGDSVLDQIGQHVHACAENLPDRSTAYCEAAARACGDRLASLITGAPLEDAVRLLEASAPYLSLSDSDLREMARRFPWPDEILDAKVRHLHGRLRSASYLATDGAPGFVRAWGSVAQRLDQAARSAANVTSASITNSDSIGATVQLLSDPAGETDSPNFAWDLQSRRDRRDDAVNQAAVDLATHLGECCPELEVVEVITILADGKHFKLGDLEPGHKRLARDARPARHIVRANVGVQAAISRQVAACSWTELVRHRTRIGTLVALLTDEAPRRLGSNDNQQRRADWVRRLDEADLLLATLPRPPATSELDVGSAAAKWDRDREEDNLSAALRHVALMLRSLVPEDPARLVPSGASGQARDAARKLVEAVSKVDVLMTAEERSAYADLPKSLGRLSGLLSAIAFDSTVSNKIKGSPDVFLDNLNRLIDAIAARQLQEERGILKEAFLGVSDAEIFQVPSEDPFVTSIAGHQWLVTVPAENWDEIVVLAAEKPLGITGVSVSVVCTTDEALLPIAVRLSTMVSAGSIPLGPESVEQFGSALGRDTIDGPALNLVGDVARELALASWKNARRWLRPSEWPGVDGDPAADVLEVQHLLDSAPSDEQDMLSTMHDLLFRVLAEFKGQDVGAVAAELVGAQLLESAVLPAGHAMEHVAQAVLASLDLELARAGLSSFET